MRGRAAGGQRSAAQDRSLMKEISIEGLLPDEILQLTDEEMDQLVLIGEPLVFRAGSSEILGEFKLRSKIFRE